jgi:uncharacterized protein YgiM (DUF1202 family)
MSLRSRLAISLAIGTLAAAAAASPAVADEDGEDWGHHHDHDQRSSKGVVTADTLLLRSAPNRGSQVIRTAHRGEIVTIFCKAAGESVQGNPLWYLLPDGTWAWGSARYIKNIGPSPHWC